MSDIERAARDAAEAMKNTKTYRVVYELEAVVMAPPGVSEEMVRLSVMDAVSLATTLTQKLKRIDCRTFPGDLKPLSAG